MRTALLSCSGALSHRAVWDLYDFTCYYTSMSLDSAESPFNKDVLSLSEKMDLAYDNRDQNKLRSLINDAERLIPKLDAISQFYLYYILGTAQAYLSSFHTPNYHEKNLEKRIYYLRKSEESLKQIPTDINFNCNPHILGIMRRLYVNYAICLNNCGRYIAAIPYFFKTLNIDKQFGMALGNLGLTYLRYAQLVDDTGHQYYLHQYAYRYLKEAISYPERLDPDAINGFSKIIEPYDPDFIREIDNNQLGAKTCNYYDKDELKYRKWVLESHLFLHPLNDLPDQYLCYATDFIQLNLILKIEEKPVCLGLFNQIKQEYIFSRYLYYESLHIQEKPHFADKDTYLTDTLDYSIYSIRLEKMKTAFRILYSLFDKVAFFINKYYNLGLSETEVNFTSIWSKIKCTPENADSINLAQNPPLNAIYWIQKDFNNNLCGSPNPDAKYLRDLRHALEHKFVKICLEKNLVNKS